MLAVMAILAAAPAKADSIKFFSGTTGYIGPFNGPGYVYDTIKNNPTACSGGGFGCSGHLDVIANPQTFSGGITATGLAGGSVWNDLQPNFAGLGVGLLSQGGEADQIQLGDILNIHFNVPVHLTGVATLFSSLHTPFGDGFPTGANIAGANTFLLNNIITTFGNANLGLLSLFGQDFTFTAIRGQPTFYVSGLEFSAVPLPGAVWLFASGIAGIGVLVRRRRKIQSAIAA